MTKLQKEARQTKRGGQAHLTLGTHIRRTPSDSPSSYSPAFLLASAMSSSETPEEVLTDLTWLQGTILGCIAYGGEAMLFGVCFHLLVMRYKRTRETKNIWLLSYILLLIALGSIFLASSVIVTELAFINHRDFVGGPGTWQELNFALPVNIMGNVALVLSSFITDGLLVRLLIFLTLPATPMMIQRLL